MIDKVIASVFGGIMGEAKMHPWTSLTATVALILVLWQGTHHASASDVAAISDTLVEIRAAQIEDKLLTAMRRFCYSSENDQKHYFGDLVREYGNQYRQVTGRTYVLPSCTEV